MRPARLHDIVRQVVEAGLGDKLRHVGGERKSDSPFIHSSGPPGIIARRAITASLGRVRQKTETVVAPKVSAPHPVRTQRATSRRNFAPRPRSFTVSRPEIWQIIGAA
jgi:hypothetical protein